VIVSERSQGPSDTRSEALRARWRAIALDAARQSGRGDCPELGGPEPLAAALERLGAARKICLVPGAERSFANAVAGWQRSDPRASGGARAPARGGAEEAPRRAAVGAVPRPARAPGPAPAPPLSAPPAGGRAASPACAAPRAGRAGCGGRRAAGARGGGAR